MRKLPETKWCTARREEQTEMAFLAGKEGPCHHAVKVGRRGPRPMLGRDRGWAQMRGGISARATELECYWICTRASHKGVRKWHDLIGTLAVSRAAHATDLRAKDRIQRSVKKPSQELRENISEADTRRGERELKGSRNSRNRISMV